ncbi:MAG: uncharacterized protein JWO57_3390 [Pseudonocardiales bacterium]|nr:uncharacterized protein [Pseudonocardiales bacterium]
MRADDDRGGSVVEFVLLATLLVLLLFGVLQVAAYVYARNIVAAAAADGARHGADLGIEPSAGAPRASELIAAALGPETARRLRCAGGRTTEATSGLQVATVRCRGQLKMLFLPLRIPGLIDVTSSVLKEGG